MRIRTATMEDYPFIQALFMLEEPRIGFGWRFNLRDSLQNSLVLVSIGNGHVCDTVQYRSRLSKMRQTLSTGPVCGVVRYRHRRNKTSFIYELATVTSMRHQGIGKALIQAVIDECISKQYTELSLRAQKNTAADDYYRHIGFTPGVETESKGHVISRYWHKIIPYWRGEYKI